MRPEDLSYEPTDPPPSLDHPFYEYRESGVIVVALDADTELAESKATSSSAGRPSTDVVTDDAVEVQMQLVAKAAARGPVVVLVTDAEMEESLRDHCGRFGGLCDALSGSNVTFALVEHEGRWIRDFGPMTAWSSNGKAIVLDPRYYDIRSRQTVEYKRHQVNQQRLEILEIEKHIDDDDDADDSMVAKREQLESTYERLTRLNDILREDSGYLRDLDDLSPYAIADALFRPETFNLYRPPLFLDGGNLIELGDGHCLTTTDLVAANGGRDDLVRRALTSYYGCRSITFLQALPGPVIKHVDMFLMPVDDRRVLLASYPLEDADAGDPSERDAYFEALQAGSQELLVKAAMAMRDNERKLTDAGLTVIRVPGLLPRLDDRDIYYPTNLNGLIRVDPQGKRQVFVPTYAGYASKRQEKALQIIRESFGRSAEIIPIEATAAAKMQGAVHCLSMVVPAKLTYFADPSSQKLRSLLTAKLEKRARSITAGEPLVLKGMWQVRHSNKLRVGTKVFFGEDEILILGGRIPLHLFFDRPQKRGRDWSINLRDAPDDTSPSAATLRWLSSRRLRLLEGNDEHDAIDLERVTGD
jgi:agmatine/peptidylarginine deiminase